MLIKPSEIIKGANFSWTTFSFKVMGYPGTHFLVLVDVTNNEIVKVGTKKEIAKLLNDINS